MRKLLLTAIFTIVGLTCTARSIDERIADAMNTSDWFALDSLYREVPKDSINPFLEVFSRGLLGNRLNRPDVSIPAFEELLNKYSAGLDLSNLLNSAVMLSMDYSKVGYNAKAASVLSSVLDATKQHLDSAAIEGVQLYIDRYTALSAYRPYTISIEGAQGVVPFRIAPVGKPEKQTVLMKLENSTVNGQEADITFDTGAGVNIISDSLAQKLNLIPLEAYNNVLGIGHQRAQYVIAKEIKLGNITVTDVPFVIVDFETDNEEANQYIDCLGIVIGGELMLQLKDLTIDFENSKITVSAIAPERSNVRPNMNFSPQMNLITKGIIHNNHIWICIDTGDASYGSLNGDFFERNKDYVLANSTPETVRMAGIGGVHISEAYNLPDVNLTLGGCSVTVPQIIVNTGANPLNSDCGCNLGVKSLMQFGRIHFNMVDFTVTAYPRNYRLTVSSKLKAPTFKFKPNKPTFLQSLGFVSLSIANGLMNANAPSAPDL